MEQVNPYATPTAKVETNSFDDEFGSLRLFSAEGRLGRIRYLMYSLGLSLVAMILVMAVAMIPFVGFILMIAIYIALIVVNVFLTIQRCHDFNMTGWLSLLLLVPLAPLVFYFIPGTKAQNDYGYQPPPNSTAIKVGAFAILALFVIAIAAAVLIPAYQAYAIQAAG